MIYNLNEFIIKNNNKIKIENTIISAKGYANIAMIKYWGKYKNQIPANPSISYTLNNCYTKTSILVKPKINKNKKIQLYFYFEKKKNIVFNKKILTYLNKILKYCPYIQDYKIIINSYNNFPHSSGIASSASFISSLARCIIKLEKKLNYNNKTNNNIFFKKKASFIARIGSGSACRSIYQGLSIWGYNKYIKGSNNLYAIPYPKNMVNKIFYEYNDTVLIISSKPKLISSSKGHVLMNENPYAKIRYKIANSNINRLIKFIKNGDINNFGKIIEQESLQLHAMLLSSNPYYILLKSKTIKAINMILNYRFKKKIPIFFSLDAGCNIHILYHNKYYKHVKNLINQKLVLLCEQGKYIENSCNY